MFSLSRGWSDVHQIQLRRRVEGDFCKVRSTGANFVANFDALDARLNSGSQSLANEIVTVRHVSKQNPWEIDAISGATISSKAVGKAINQSAKRLLPALVTNLDKLLQEDNTVDLPGVADG